jgi:hypothetical protein
MLVSVSTTAPAAAAPMRHRTDEKEQALRNDLETREIADTELDAVAGGLVDAYVGAGLATTVGISASVAGTEISADLGVSAAASLSAHV